MNRLHRVAAAGAMTALGTLAFAGTALAHTSGASATCNGITTTLQFFENAAGDRVYTYIDDMGTPVDTFPGPFVTTSHTVPVPQDGATHDWKVVVDSVSGNGTQYDATYIGQVGPCGEIVTTTTEAATTTTELVTTTTEQEATTSTTSTTAPTTTSTVPASTTSTPTTIETTTSQPTTSSSVATTSTTSPPPSTSTTPAPSTSVPPSTPPAPSSTTPECSDNPNTPTDDCAPVCTPVTQPDGTNSCSTLPATGAGTLGKLVVAWCFLSVGICLFIAPRFGKSGR